jgi:hypothetical protein
LPEDAPVKVELLEPARQDLLDGYWFYELQAPGVGLRFLEEMKRQIDSLYQTAGIHRRVNERSHWIITRKFSHAIYYHVNGDIAYVEAVIDCRRSPDWIKQRLK